MCQRPQKAWRPVLSKGHPLLERSRSSVQKCPNSSKFIQNHEISWNTEAWGCPMSQFIQFIQFMPIPNRLKGYKEYSSHGLLSRRGSLGWIDGGRCYLKYPVVVPVVVIRSYVSDNNKDKNQNLSTNPYIYIYVCELPSKSFKSQ